MTTLAESFSVWTWGCVPVPSLTALARLTAEADLFARLRSVDELGVVIRDVAVFREGETHIRDVELLVTDGR